MSNNTTDRDKALAWWTNLGMSKRTPYRDTFASALNGLVPEEKIIELWQQSTDYARPAPSTSSIEEGLQKFAVVHDEYNSKIYAKAEAGDYETGHIEIKVSDQLGKKAPETLKRILTAIDCHDDLVKALEAAGEAIYSLIIARHSESDAENNPSYLAVKGALTKATKH